jgi:uncharacterized membrane-anchored protein
MATLKYTAEFVLEEMKSMVSLIKGNPDIVYIWELFDNKSYSRQRFSEWVKTYSDNEEIKEISDTIKEILETRAVKGAMTNKLNGTMTIFHLKNNYDWKDKSEVDSNVKGELNIATLLWQIQDKN